MAVTHTSRKTRRSRSAEAVTTTPVAQPLHDDVAAQQETIPVSDIQEEDPPTRSLEDLPTDEVDRYEDVSCIARTSTPQPLIITARTTAAASAITAREGDDEQRAYRYAGDTRPRQAAWPRTERTHSSLRRLRKRTFPVDAHSFWQVHWQKLAVGMLVMLGLILLWGLVSLEWTTLYDQIVYGFPRTMQLDAVLDDHDSTAHPSHLIAFNLHGQVEVIILPGGDATHAQVLLGPRLTGPAADQAMVRVRVADDPRTGKPELLVQITGAPLFLASSPTMTLIARNSGNGFAPFVLAEQQ